MKREADGPEHGKAPHNILNLNEAAEMYLVGILEEKQSYESRDVCQKDIVLKSMCPVLLVVSFVLF